MKSVEVGVAVGKLGKLGCQDVNRQGKEQVDDGKEVGEREKGRMEVEEDKK